MNKKKSFYFDYAATTPVDSRVLKAMLPYFDQKIGNTMSLHQSGMEASEAVEKVREKIASYIGAKADEVVFTASATESNNLALKGVAEANPAKTKIIISAVEHDCVLKSAAWLLKKGYEVLKAPVDKDGLVDIDWLSKNVDKKTLLVSIIHANNEVGTIQDLKKIGEICRERGTYFHTDASQSFGKEKIDVEDMKIDLLTASSHKMYGPKGAAILYVKDKVLINPILHGGGHEGGLRSSTVNVPAIVGMGKATEISYKVIKSESLKLKTLRDYLIKNILKSVDNCWLNGHPTKRLANNVNISFAKVEGEGLLLELSNRGIMCSTGSACSSSSLEPSHVLLAMGLTAPEAHGSLRFSLGRYTQKSDVDFLLKVLPEVIKKIRKISPFKL